MYVSVSELLGLSESVLLSRRAFHNESVDRYICTRGAFEECLQHRILQPNAVELATKTRLGSMHVSLFRNVCVPSQCPQNNGDPVLRPGNVCFLRSDGWDETEVHWKDAKIFDLSGGSGLPEPRSCWCQGGTIHSSLDYCCGACGGQCGGPGCSDLPGGSSQCCSGHIEDSNDYCSSPTDTACIIP